MDHVRLPYPFKRPFKGKRIAARDLEDLGIERDKISNQMEKLSNEWVSRTDIEGIKLVLLKQGHPVLRWRLSQKVYGDQRYVELFAESGSAITSSLSKEAIQFMLGFETHRLLLNAKSRAVNASYAAFDDYLRQIRTIKTCLAN